MKNSRKNENIPSPQDLLVLLQKQKRPMRIDALLRVASLGRSAKKDIERCLAELSAEGLITRLPGGFWLPVKALKSIEGRFLAKSAGGGRVIVSHPEKNMRELLVHPLQTGDAWHNDLVRAIIFPGTNPPQGRIVEVLRRGNEEVFARVTQKHVKTMDCRPVDRRLPANFHVRLGNSALARELRKGTLVSVKPEKSLAPDLWQAALVNIYGSENQVEVQEAIVKSSHGVPGDFPSLALASAEALPVAPTAADMAGREDWRKVPFVTIDGEDARDFDDAIHVEKTSDGWILRVAIADVANYVPQDQTSDSLDAEARRRGNSWYFPRSVEPMLPKILSNGLCSLRPHEDRLAVMAEMPFSLSGKAGTPRFAHICMRSAGRLIYSDVSDFFAEMEKPEATTSKEAPIPWDSQISGMLKEARALFRVLAANRKKRGTLDFDLPEPAYSFDEHGHLEHMGIASSGEANRLIEEFMIAANEAVASFLGTTQIPFLYRVHPTPEPAKLQTLLDTLQNMAPEALPPGIDAASLADPRNIQKILSRAKGRPWEYVVNRLCLRSMPQARYQPENLGHFGLASTSYCHFTSPIRRYADLATHRALKQALGFPQSKLPDIEELSRMGDELNSLEREAMECEREMAKRLACMALKPREGEILAGSVSGVTDFGLFVEFDELPAEGLIPIQVLGDEWFELDQLRQRLIGMRSGAIWKLGQPVRVRIKNVDLDRLETRLEPVSEAKGKVSASHRKNKSHIKNAPQKQTRASLPGKSSAGKKKRTDGRRQKTSSSTPVRNKGSRRKRNS